MTHIRDESYRTLAATSERPRKGAVRSILGTLLVCAAVPYLGYYLVQRWQALGEDIALIQPASLFAAFALLLLMLALKAVYHVISIRRLGNLDGPPASRIINAYATSQLVRYLPGKVLGVAYEVAHLSGQVTAQRVVAANIVQGLLTNALSVGIMASAALWLIADQAALGVALMAFTVAALWAAHRLHLVERTLAWVVVRTPWGKHAPTLPKASGHASFRASLLLLGEWVPYFLCWMLLVPTGPHWLEQGVVLGICYAAASLVGSLAVVVPSGLIVREAVFLWVGTRLAMDPDTLILLGMVSRLLLTLADAALVPLAWAADRLLARSRR